MYFLLITKHILLINHKCVYLYQYKSSHLWDEVEKEFETWGSKTYSRISYISQERELLEDMLRNVWIKIESEKDKVDADTWDYISLIKEDYPHILG